MRPHPRSTPRPRTAQLSWGSTVRSTRSPHCAMLRRGRGAACGPAVVLAQASETRRKATWGRRHPDECSTRPARSWRHATRSSTWQPTSSMRRRPRRCSAPARGLLLVVGTRTRRLSPWCPVRSVPGARRAPTAVLIVRSAPGGEATTRSGRRSSSHRRLPGGDGSAALGLAEGERRSVPVRAVYAWFYPPSARSSPVPAGYEGMVAASSRLRRRPPRSSARRALRVPGQDQRNGTRLLAPAPTPSSWWSCHAQRGTKGAPWLDRSECALHAPVRWSSSGCEAVGGHSLAE